MWKTLGKTLGAESNIAKHEGKQARSLFDALLLHRSGKQKVWKTLRKTLTEEKESEVRGRMRRVKYEVD